MLYLVRVLTGDSGSNHVTSGAGFYSGFIEVDGRVTPWIFPIQKADVFDAVQRQAHGNLVTKQRIKKLLQDETHQNEDTRLSGL